MTSPLILIAWISCSIHLTTALTLTSEEWQSGSRKCSPCFCSITRPNSLGGSLVKYVNCSNIYLDQIPSDLPDDTEYLDVSRTPIENVQSSDSHYNGNSLMYPNLPAQFINATSGLQKLKYSDLSGNSFNEFNSDPFLSLEFLSGIFGLEVHRLTVESFSGLQNLGTLELRTPMQTLPNNLFLHLKTSKLTLHLENALTLPSSIFDHFSTSLKTLIIFADKMVELPESLLDNLLLLQKFTLEVKEMDTIPEHLLHGSTLFRSLNLKQDIPDEMWMLLHSMSSTRYLKDITIDGVKHLPKNVFQYIPYLETIVIHKTDDLEPNLFERLVRLNNLNLAQNNIKDVKEKWFQDLGGLRTLNLSNNELTETTQEDFEKLHSLEVFDLSRNKLKQAEKSVFDSFRSAIEELFLNQNDFPSLENDVFNEMWSLRELHLDNNNISEIEEPLFRDLHKLDTLTLGNNEIENIAERSFDGLQELRNLDLSNNKIETIPNGLFSNAISLQSVNISQNNLTSVSSGMLSSHFWLKDLDAGTNPLHCDCALARMVDANKQSSIAGKCSSPPKYIGMDIGDLPTSAMCTEEEVRRQEEEERRRKQEEWIRKQEEIRQREEELRKATAIAMTTTTATTTSQSTTKSPAISTVSETSMTTDSNAEPDNVIEPTIETNQTVQADNADESSDTKDIGEEKNENGTLLHGKHWSDKIKTDNINSSIETENYTEDLKDKVKVKTESDIDKITTSSKYPDENNNISDDVNDVGQTDQDSNKVKSDIIMNSQKLRKSNWTKTPWAIAVIILICILFVIGSVFGVVKARGYLYRDNYDFNFSRAEIIDAEDESILY